MMNNGRGVTKSQLAEAIEAPAKRFSVRSCGYDVLAAVVCKETRDYLALETWHQTGDGNVGRWRMSWGEALSTCSVAVHAPSVYLAKVLSSESNKHENKITCPDAVKIAENSFPATI